jgi:DNA-binding response OmpR family regulator
VAAVIATRLHCAPLHSSKTAASAASTGEPTRALRVLVVDDERDIVLTLLALLRDEGYEAKGVYSAADALVALAEFDPDALIVDIALPGRSGWEIARAVRKLGPYGEQRPLLIAISGRYTKGSDRILGEISGFNYQLAKPFDPTELIALLKSVKT